MKVVSFHPFRQHNFEQAENLRKQRGMKMELHTTIALPPFFRVFNIKKGRIITWNLFINSRQYSIIYLKYLINRDMNYLVNHFQKSVISKLKKNQPDVIIGFDGCSKMVFEEFSGKVNLVLDFTTLLDEYNFVINPKSYTDKITYLNNNLLNSRYYKNKLREIELANLIIVGSRQVRDSILFKYPEYEKKIKVIHYGYNPEIFFRNRISSSEKKKQIKFLVVGTLSYHKGSDLIFEAWKKIVTNHSNVELHICGACYPEFEVFLKLPNVNYHGFVSQEYLADLMNQSDILLHPTYIEGYSISVLQALVCGMTIIATSNTGIELENNINGKIIKVGSKSELYAAMCDLIENKDSMNVYSEQNIKQFSQFTWDKYAEELYLELQTYFQ